MPVSKNRRKNGKKSKKVVSFRQRQTIKQKFDHERTLKKQLDVLCFIVSEATGCPISVNDAIQKYKEYKKGLDLCRTLTEPEKEKAALNFAIEWANEESLWHLLENHAVDTFDGFGLSVAEKESLDLIAPVIATKRPNDSEYTENEKAIIKQAGEMLNKEGLMNSEEFWRFIPKPIHSEISFFWNGIGDWRD